MTLPPVPANEAGRLAALRELKILDTDPEERFDRITALARRLFDVPVALVTLVDQDRVWFKSRAGLEVTEMPRSISFCGHAIADDRMLVVPDAGKDARFRDNPQVTGERGHRFYASYPLRGRDGSPIGTFCIIDRKPRELTHDDQDILKDLAGAVEQQLTRSQTRMIDELTGLSNRRGLIVAGDYLVRVAQRSGAPISVLYFDLDGFKSINDVHGHAMGDAVLADFARGLVQSFRGSDVVARFGGDEFCVVMCGAATSEASLPLPRLDAALRAAGASRPFEIRYNLEVIPFRLERDESIADVLEGADRRKHLGKRAQHVPTA